MIEEREHRYLQRAVDLAKKALEKGDEPFGSVLVSADGEILAEDHNHVGSGDRTQHPEIYLARWAARNLSLEERKKATVYTSGEHCPMCAAAHGWVGLGRIVYASSSEQLGEWLQEFGAEDSPIYTLPIEDIIKDAEVVGPVPDFAAQVRALHETFHRK